MKNFRANKFSEKIGSLSNKSIERINKFYRDKAISETKKELKFRQKKWSDYTKKELEEIVDLKEKELRSKHKMTGLRLALIPFGLGWFIN